MIINLQTNEMYILICFILPFLGIISAAVISSPNIRDSITIAIATLLFMNVINILHIFNHNSQYVSLHVLDLFPGLSISFSVEPLGMIFALLISFLWIVSTIYSIGYMRGNKEKHQNRFFSFFAFAIFASFGIAFASNMLTLFIFYEMLTICTFPLVTHSATGEAKKSGRIYLGILMGTSLLLFLPAIMITYNVAGTLDFISGGILSDKSTVALTSLLLFLFMFGIGKAALMPIHRWLPAAMVAPTPVSALLHAVAVVKAGVFTIVKVIVYIFGIDYLSELASAHWYSGQWLIWIASFTIIVASILALQQDNLKKRLAYSTISQLSYVVLAVAMLVPASITAAAFHIAAHAVSKITLFFAAGSIYTVSGKTKVSQLSGIGRKMPITMLAFSVAAFSMIGIPPTVGFLSKWYMLTGVFESHLYFVIGVIIISTLLNCSYFLPIIYKAFFEKENGGRKQFGEAPVTIVLALAITMFGVIALFVYPGVFLELALRVGL